MKESIVCTRIVNGFLEAGHEAFKIPDMPRTAGTKFNRKKGYDITAAINREAICIEVKINPSLPKKLSSFLKLFTPAQIERFDRVTKNNSAYCYGFLCVFKNNRKASLRRHELYIFDWTQIMRSNYLPQYKKPVKCYKERYDLSQFFRSHTDF